MKSQSRARRVVMPALEWLAFVACLLLLSVGLTAAYQAVAAWAVRVAVGGR